MAGIAGITAPGTASEVDRMLSEMAHRGKAGRAILMDERLTLGAVWPQAQPTAFCADETAVRDLAPDGRFAGARLTGGRPLLMRDRFGIAPLYFGRAETGALCFASEVKALLSVTRDVNLLPPGSSFDGEAVTPCVFTAPPAPPPSAGEAAAALRTKLEAAVRACVQSPVAGSWLSGGIDSSALVALARPCVKTLHTFAAGLRDAPDLAFAREVAAFVGCAHHEVVVSPGELAAALPQVIFHLESFDALLVRSSVTNYLVAKLASDYVPAVFSGEGGDELFAGYAYLKGLDPKLLPDELADITGRLHNTALQRVDRTSQAHGLVAYVPFLNPEVADFARLIPAELKIRNGMEKWILRQALDGLLPEKALWRPKAKFWEGAGVTSRLAEHAEERVSDGDFRRSRTLPDGQRLNTKEELLYYRIFSDFFGRAETFRWVGRTKGAPRAEDNEGEPS